MNSTTKLEYRDTIISLAVLAIIYYYFPHVGIILTFSVFFLLAVLFKSFRNLNHRFWLSITKITQAIFSPVIMTVIFIVVIIPIGLLFQLKNRKQEDNPTSFLSDYNEEYNLDYFKRPW